MLKQLDGKCSDSEERRKNHQGKRCDADVEGAFTRLRGTALRDAAHREEWQSTDLSDQARVKEDLGEGEEDREVGVEAIGCFDDAQDLTVSAIGRKDDFVDLFFMHDAGEPRGGSQMAAVFEPDVGGETHERDRRQAGLGIRFQLAHHKVPHLAVPYDERPAKPEPGSTRPHDEKPRHTLRKDQASNSGSGETEG